MLSGKERPVFYAHRGSSIYAPENTLAAFTRALEQGADGIELDVKLSADGEVVVIHDQTVDRTTNGRGRVNHLKLHQLRELDAGSYRQLVDPHARGARLAPGVYFYQLDADGTRAARKLILAP